MNIRWSEKAVGARYRQRICCGAVVLAACVAGICSVGMGQSPGASQAVYAGQRSDGVVAAKPEQKSPAERLRAADPGTGAVVGAAAGAATMPGSAAGGAGSAARRAVVRLQDGILIVESNNSDLTQILHDVAAASGTTIHGQVKSARIYGVYGPASPVQVLRELLTGSGYNFLMVGVTKQGAPRDLVLTVESTEAAPAASGGAAVAQPADVEAEIPDEEPPGPGAIVHTPPVPPEDLRDRVEQNLRRLQQMQEQQQQQEPPQ